MVSYDGNQYYGNNPKNSNGEEILWCYYTKMPALHESNYYIFNFKFTSEPNRSGGTYPIHGDLSFNLLTPKLERTSYDRFSSPHLGIYNHVIFRTNFWTSTKTLIIIDLICDDKISGSFEFINLWDSYLNEYININGTFTDIPFKPGM